MLIITTTSAAPSLHSRAARRATSPSIDTDKSLKNVKPPPESIDHRPSILAIHHGAGVSKKTRKGRNASFKARRRQEKAQDRAAAIMERTELKAARSKGQARAIQTRKKAWDDINEHMPLDSRKSDKSQDRDGDGDWDEDSDSGFDDEMDEAEAEKQQGNAAAEANKVPLLPTMDEDEDGIL